MKLAYNRPAPIEDGWNVGSIDFPVFHPLDRADFIRLIAFGSALMLAVQSGSPFVPKSAGSPRLVRIGIGHQQKRSRHHSNCLPSLLCFNDTILNAERVGIAENRLGGFEADLVLCEVATVLVVIPFKAHQQAFYIAF
jgi:hypothetical protein